MKASSRNYLREHLPAIAENLQIEIQPNNWLDVEHKEKAYPDTLLRNDGRRHIVLDTKYKPFEEKPATGDLFQMMAYCNSLHLEDAILIYPGATNIHYRRRFHGFDVGALNLDLDGDLETFRRRCRCFARRLARVASAASQHLGA